MPKLSNKQAVKKSSGSLFKKKKQELLEDDDDLLDGETDIDDSEEEEEFKPKVELITPFTDGLVASSLNGFVAISRIGGPDIELLKGFLKYFSVNGSFIGTVSNKTSFMKKKGGLLL